MHEWLLGSELEESELRIISEGVIGFGRKSASAGNALPLACVVREDGKLLGGAVGRTEFDRLFVQYLWVDDGHRGKGLGSTILARFEAAGLERGCKDAIIETLDDRAAELYQRLGYAILCTIPAYVGPFSRRTLLKRLRS